MQLLGHDIQVSNVILIYVITTNSKKSRVFFGSFGPIPYLTYC